MIKIIFTDVDGTLFDSTGGLSEITRNACIKAQENNIKIVINTGHYGENAIRVGTMINADKYDSYIIGNDGAEIWSYQQQKWIYLQQLPKTTVAKLYDWLINYDNKFLLHFNSINTCFASHNDNSWGPWAQKLQIKIVNLTKQAVMIEPISKVMVIWEKYHDAKDIANFIAQFNDHFPDLTIVQYYTNVFSIGCKDINKGSAVQWLCQQLNINLQHALTIGDSFNDLPMFENVGYPVVMDNANNAIKPYGKIIAPSNDNHGVAAIITKFVLKNK